MNDLSAQSNLHLTLSPKPRVAILVDGDNVPHSALAEIEAKAASLGNPILRRVYADMGLRKDWAAETDYLATHCTTSAGKNRADIQLVIGAMDIAHRGLATHFLILSDDRDFGPLVAHLREIGKSVEWAGKPKLAPKPITIPALAKEMVTLEDKVIALILNEGQSKSMSIGMLGGRMHSLHKVKIGLEPEKTWRAFLLARPKTFLCDPRSSTAQVKLLNR